MVSPMETSGDADWTLFDVMDSFGSSVPYAHDERNSMSTDAETSASASYDGRFNNYHTNPSDVDYLNLISPVEPAQFAAFAPAPVKYERNDDGEENQSVQRKKSVKRERDDDMPVQDQRGNVGTDQSGRDSGEEGNKTGKAGMSTKDRRQLTARLSRQRRKQELVELRKRIKLLEQEQLEFLARISDLESEATMLQHSGTQDLKEENELLRLEIEEHRSFVQKLQELMFQTKTSALELERHSKKTDRIELRRRCIECAETAMSQCIGLVRLSTKALKDPPTPGQENHWQSAILEGNDDMNVVFELLPHGSEFNEALRMNSRMEVEFPMSVHRTSRMIRRLNRDKKYSKILEQEHILSCDFIYVDEDYEDKICDEKAVLRARYVKEKVSPGNTVSSVGVTMAKAVKIEQSSLIPDGDPNVMVDCVIHCHSDASHIFPEPPNSKNKKATDETVATPNTTPLTPLTPLTPDSPAPAPDEALTLLDMLGSRTPSKQKFFFAASLIVPGETPDTCTLMILRSEPFDDDKRRRMALTDGAFRGPVARRLIGGVQRLREQLLETPEEEDELLAKVN